MSYWPARRNTPPVTSSARTDAALLPAFWKIYEEFGTFKENTTGTPETIAQLKKQGVSWLDVTRAEDYTLSNYDCISARNGADFLVWKVAVPFPRLPGRPWSFMNADSAVVGDYLLPPDPQSIPGMHTASVGLDPRAAPPVHVPMPMFDVGSGVDLSPPAPDGNWWATVGSIDDEIDCVNASVPICLAKAMRPWRAIWYVEPPPVGTIDPTTPRVPSDVRVCYYSDSETYSLLADSPREQTNTSGHYQVVLDTPPGNRSMMHTLPDLTPGDLEGWLTHWLYGTGSNLARAYGQDQVDPDRYCWYKWYQAQNDVDGFEGVLSVEWLATIYIGVPSDIYAYCQGGVPGNYDGFGPHPRQLSLDGGSYDCDYNRNANPDAPKDYWQAVATDFNAPGNPSGALNWFGDSVNRFSWCHVGSERLNDMERPFDWFLQAATVIVENEQEAGPSNREAMHPLGSSLSLTGPPHITRSGRSPAPPGSSLSNSWWRGDSSSAVGTPQNQGTTLNNPMFSTPLPDDSGLLAHTNAWRKYQSHVTALTYPTSLSDTAGHPDCNRVPVTVKSLPCQSWSGGACRASSKSWWDMFNYQVDANGNPVISGGRPVPSATESPNSDLWAWWSQQVAEVRHQTFPIPVDP